MDNKEVNELKGNNEELKANPSENFKINLPESNH